MQLVDHDTFFKRLAELFEASNGRGSSIWLTHKRLNREGETSAVKVDDPIEDTNEYPCLVRASNRNKETKFSTRVEPGQLPKFNAAYGTLLKSSMTSLRKRDKKREKTRQEQIAAKKKRMSEPVPVEGPKRGNGRRKRQRRLKAVAKQQEARKKAEEREKERAKKSAVASGSGT